MDALDICGLGKLCNEGRRGRRRWRVAAVERSVAAAIAWKETIKTTEVPQKDSRGVLESLMAF